MDTYELLRDIADSWFLLFLFSFFVGCVIWAFRPGSTEAYKDTVNIPFRHDDMPASEPATVSAEKEAS